MSTSLEEEVLQFIVGTLEAVTVERRRRRGSSLTVLKALGLRSIVLINAVAEIQEHFKLENRLLERILGGDVPLDEHKRRRPGRLRRRRHQELS